MPPEMVKRRPVIVLSPRTRHSQELCTVVPLSTSPPIRENELQVPLELPVAPPHPFDETEVWAKCNMVSTVAFKRLDLFRGPRQRNGARKHLKLRVTDEQYEAIKAGVRSALGLT